MRLNGQQKKLATAFAFVFCIAIGTLVFFDSEHVDERRIQVLILSTSTPKDGITSDGWWNSIPTDPSLPIMPASGISTLTPTVVSMVDQFLRPWLIGQDVQIPILLLVLSVLGGLGLYGLLGLFVGPIIISLFMTAIQIYREEYFVPDAAKAHGAPPSS